MKLPTEFSALDEIRKRMEAPLSSWTPKRQRAPKTAPQYIPLTPGNFNKIRPDSEGILVDDKEIPVLIYIKDTRKDYHTLKNNPQDSPRFHIAECYTIKQMRMYGRIDRYVKTYETHGDFSVEATDHDEPFETKLYVCKNCLNSLNLRGRYGEWPEFSIEDLLRDYKPRFSPPPQYTDVTAPPGGYPKSWTDIATAYKNSKGWKCEKCRVDLNKHKGLLHAHHISGVTSDSNPANLQALCVECHNEQPQHGHFPPSKGERDTLAELRAAQGLPAGHRKSMGAV